MESESPPARSSTTRLSSFLRGRPRNSSQSFSPAVVESGSPPLLQSSLSHPSTNLGLTHILRRSNNNNNNQVQPQTQPPASSDPVLSSSSPTMNPQPYRIRLVPHLDSRRSLRFDPITRDLRQGEPPLRIGRFTDRSGLGISAINSTNPDKLAFRSKVVSRVHAEIWVADGGKFFIRDTKSSSGTFLNHVRLSAANVESRPFHIRDGDILQLGVDYQGGAEDIYKSVKIRVEMGREWQAGINAFK